MKQLGIIDSLALGILSTGGPFQAGRLGKWAKGRLEPLWKTESERLRRALVEQVSEDPRFKNKKATVTTWANLNQNQFEVKGVIETGISLDGITSGLFSPYKEARDITII